MPRKRKPFQQKRETPAPYRRGERVAYYIASDVLRAIADVARARGNISRSQLVNDILAAHPDIAAQLDLYRVLGDVYTDAAPLPISPDAGATRESDQEQEGLWDEVPTVPGPDTTSPDAGARKKRGKRGERETFPFSTDAGADGERSGAGASGHKSDAGHESDAGATRESDAGHKSDAGHLADLSPRGERDQERALFVAVG